jgi:ketosteroid isomerase-like protein
VIDGGFLQEHVLRGTAPGGQVVAMPACIIATVADGRITRIHEYLDPAGVAALTA